MNWRDFSLPFGPRTDARYGAAAAPAWAGMVGNLGQAAGYVDAAKANAEANRFGSLAGGLSGGYGAYSSGIGNLYGTYGNTLSNLGAAGSNYYGTLGQGLSSLGANRAGAAAARNNSYTGLATGLGNSAASTYNSYGNALSGLANAQSNESTGLANAYAGMMGGIGSSTANAYNAYAGGLGNLASARAAETGNRYNSNAMAEAARQAAVGNLGSAALGAYGSAAGSMFGAFGQSESAYQNAMGNIGTANQNAIGNIGSSSQAAIANIGAANQQGVSGLGQSRNAALAGLGDSYSRAGTGLGASALAGELDLSFTDYGYGGGGGGGFNASGPGGGIASGSYGGGGFGSGGMSLEASRSNQSGDLTGVTNQTFAGLGRLGSQLDNQQGYGELASGLGMSYGQVGQNAGQAYGALASGLEKAQPQRADYSFLTDNLNNTLAGVRGLANDGYGASGAGMNQFYDNQPELTNYSSLSNLLTSGFNNARSDISGSAQLAAGSPVFNRTDYSDYANRLTGGYRGVGENLASLGNAAFSGISSNQYRDDDLLAGLHQGFGAGMASNERLADRASSGFGGTTGMLTGNYESFVDQLGGAYADRLDIPNTPGSVLEGLMQEEVEDNALRPGVAAARARYQELINAGPVSRLDEMSPDYDREVAREAAWLRRQIASANRTYNGTPQFA